MKMIHRLVKNRKSCEMQPKFRAFCQNCCFTGKQKDWAFSEGGANTRLGAWSPAGGRQELDASRQRWENLFTVPGLCLGQHAAELVAKVASHYDEYVSVKDLGDKINRALVAAKKDNDFIYHDRVPEVKDLEPIGKAALVKATAITPPISQKFTGEPRPPLHEAPQTPASLSSTAFTAAPVPPPQTCLRRWCPWRCSSPWACTTRGRRRRSTEWWEP